MLNNITDLESDVHKFELAGLGKAPFKITGYCGLPFPTASCKYCGAAIANVFFVKSSDGQTFSVGPDCVNKTGDAGLIKQYKTLPEYKEAKRKAAVQKGETIKAQMSEIISKHETELKSKPHPNKYMAESKGLTLYDYANWILKFSGAANRNQVFKWLKQTFQS